LDVWCSVCSRKTRRAKACRRTHGVSLALGVSPAGCLQESIGRRRRSGSAHGVRRCRSIIFNCIAIIQVTPVVSPLLVFCSVTRMSHSRCWVLSGQQLVLLSHLGHSAWTPTTQQLLTFRIPAVRPPWKHATHPGCQGRHAPHPPISYPHSFEHSEDFTRHKLRAVSLNEVPTPICNLELRVLSE